MRQQALALIAVLMLAACAPQTPPAAAPAKPAAPSAPSQPSAAAPAAPTAAPQASAPASSPAGPINVKYAYAPRLPMVPVFVAQEKGFFTAQGLDVEFVPFAGGSNEMLPPLSQGQLDVAAAGLSAGMVNAAADGVLFRMVADEGQIAHGRSVYNLSVRSDVAAKFKTVADLRGSTGGAPAIDSGLSLPYTFYKITQAAGLTTPDGLDFANFNFVETPPGGQGDQMAMFQNKVQEWQITVEPTPALLEDLGLGVRWLRTDEIVKEPIQAYTILYGERFMRDKPEAARKFMVAYLQGLRYFLDNVDTNAAEINAIAAKHAKMPESVVANSLWAYYDPNGRMDLPSLQDQHDFWLKKGLIRKGVGQVSQLIDYSYLDGALAQLGTR
ncbi:MAG TPA: ABC transporter substrate-binding protein [Chloroflexota bacterium]|nr:ABC transporter substrate-binding protein [Chloroflexota bacterium]